MDYPEHMRAYVESEMRPDREAQVTKDFRIEHRGYSIRKQPEYAPIIINNYNRLTYLRETVDALRTRGYENLYVIDNNSDYEPLLEYYDASGLKVFYLDKNVGYLALWRTPIFKEFINDYHVYTDSDIVPADDCPKDIIAHLKSVLDAYPQARKAGLGLRIDDLPDHYALKSQVVSHESQFWAKRLAAGVYAAPIDTTFALYRAGTRGGWWLPAVRTGEPYMARHLPWYSDSSNPTDEERQYLRTASSSTHWTQEEAPLADEWPEGPGLSEYFDHIYCVNLARRPDRWAEATEQFEALGLEVERFEAIDGSSLEDLPTVVHLAQSRQAIPGVVGCSLSHRAVLQDALDKGYEHVLILEDDVVFSEHADRDFSRVITQVPSDWAMLYLGGNHQGGLRPVARNVARTGGTYTTNCYAVNAESIRMLLELLPSDPGAVRAPVDVVYYSVHQKLPSYVLRPHLAWQRDGYSDVELLDVEYGFLRD